jgi:hypothetical protein
MRLSRAQAREVRTGARMGDGMFAAMDPCGPAQPNIRSRAGVTSWLDEVPVQRELVTQDWRG